jgi:BirA family biotin operon repressor/biotin-[acetyl-CoA-carboxylase] ligase
VKTVAPLEKDKVFSSLHGPLLIGEQGEILASVTSTMDVARERLLAGAPDGYVVVAENQTQGRGREGAWECPPGLGVLLDVVLRARLAASEQKVVVLLGTVAAAEAVRRLGLPARIKWPNDIVIASELAGRFAVRKLGGALAERVVRKNAPAAHVLGIGLNVNQRAEDLPAGAARTPTSMRIERGGEFDRNRVCRILLQELNYWYQRLRMGQPERILARWRRLSCLLQRRVRVRVDGRALTGTVLGIRSSGELIFQEEGGHRRLLSDRDAELLL